MCPDDTKGLIAMSSLNESLTHTDSLVPAAQVAPPDAAQARSEALREAPAAAAAPVLTPARKHSAWGIASFVWSVATGAGELLVIGLSGALYAVNPNLVQPPSLALGALTLLLCAAFPAGLIGISLGLAGLVQQDRRKVFAFLGLAVSLAIMAGVGLLWFVGSQMPGPTPVQAAALAGAVCSVA
jgi:hypothetical protein